VNPCVEWCYNRFGKEYTEKCDSYCEYAKALMELRQAKESLRLARAEYEEIVQLRKELERVVEDRDNLIKRTREKCWSCIRRYECNSRHGPHKRCWEFDASLLRED
jgi:ABC-type uncharacterized transport system fused permease/ATPase subunit